MVIATSATVIAIVGVEAIASVLSGRLQIAVIVTNLLVVSNISKKKKKKGKGSCRRTSRDMQR